MYRAPTLAWSIASGTSPPHKVNDHVIAAGCSGGQARVDGLVICEVDDRVGPAVSGLFKGLSAGGPDDPVGELSSGLSTAKAAATHPRQSLRRDNGPLSVFRRR
jgi:hypothetical protein